MGLLWQAYQVREVDGPVSLLGESLDACDLDLDEHLQLLADHGTLDLSTAPWRAVYLLIVRGFHKAEGRNLAHRRILGQVGIINVDLFRSGLKGLSEEHQGLVRVAATGARFEHAEIARFSDKFDEMCRLCGELDTRSHRLTSCPATEHVRERHREVLEKWDSFPEPLKLHLLPSEAPFRGEFLSRLGSVPPPDIVRRPPGPKTIWFTDASGKNPASRFSLVSFAGVCIDPDTSQVTSSFQGILPGILQSVDRGEILAIIGTLQRVHHCDIYTDSNYAADFNVLLGQGWQEEFKVRPNADLLTLGATALGTRTSNEVRIQWVKAHRSIHTAISGADAFRIRGNGISLPPFTSRLQKSLPKKLHLPGVKQCHSKDHLPRLGSYVLLIAGTSQLSELSSLQTSCGTFASLLHTCNGMISRRSMEVVRPLFYFACFSTSRPVARCRYGIALLGIGAHAQTRASADRPARSS